MVNAGCCAIHLAESSAGAAHFLPRRNVAAARVCQTPTHPPSLRHWRVRRTVKRNERLDLE